MAKIPFPRWHSPWVTTVGREKENGSRPCPQDGAFAGHHAAWETKGRDGGKPWGRQELTGYFCGTWDVLAHEGSVPCPPDSDDVGADVSDLWVCCGKETISPGTRWLRPSNQLALQRSLQNSFWLWNAVFPIGYYCKPGKKLQPPKVTPPKRSIHFQQMLPAVSLFPASKLQLKKGLQQCPLCPVVSVLDALDLKRGHNNFWAWIDMEYSNILGYPWQSFSGLYQSVLRM